MIILHDPDTLLHETVELLGSKTRPALESPERIRSIVTAVSSSDHEFRIIISPTRDNDPRNLKALLEIVSITHDAGYLEHIQNVFSNWQVAGLIDQSKSVLPECFILPNSARSKPHPPVDIYARVGYYAFDMSSGIMDQTYISTLASANLAYQATELLRKNNTKDVLALCRPPGHHCDGHRAGGYCYINNAAVAISAWQRHAPSESRIGVLDVDFHHGNGTQEIYYNDSQVFYTSIHGEDEFPYYTGMADERGGEAAAGKNLNLPLKTGSSFEAYLEKLDEALNALKEFDPEFLLVSLGFDTFYLDPLGTFKIETADYKVMARRIRERLADIPAVILLEGGYVLEHLGPNVLSFLEGWESAMQDEGR